jgi:hypothetical protein
MADYQGNQCQRQLPIPPLVKPGSLFIIDLGMEKGIQEL